MKKILITTTIYTVLVLMILTTIVLGFPKYFIIGFAIYILGAWTFVLHNLVWSKK